MERYLKPDHLDYDTSDWDSTNGVIGGKCSKDFLQRCSYFQARLWQVLKILLFFYTIFPLQFIEICLNVRITKLPWKFWRPCSSRKRIPFLRDTYSPPGVNCQRKALKSICSNNRSISFRESMPLLRESVTHRPINWQSALIPSPSQELFF